MFWKRTFLWHVSADDDAVAPEATFPCPHCSQPVPEISMAHFSFNKPEGACPTCTGLGIIHQVTIHGARQHNLQNINVRLPPGLLIAVTGVSGSGKSSLIFDILDRTMRQRLYDASDTPGEHDTIESYAYLDKIITIDQGHIGRIPRSNAATSSETFTPIREAFAATP
ncbi:MAG TPA: hypothetical protein VKV40_15320 [Ktedonobacteraceae bacterium]|nr:hypothetical protein [Ktedonobacteraceae bacterium]